VTGALTRWRVLIAVLVIAGSACTSAPPSTNEDALAAGRLAVERLLSIEDGNGQRFEDYVRERYVAECPTMEVEDVNFWYLW